MEIENTKHSTYLGRRLRRRCEGTTKKLQHNTKTTTKNMTEKKREQREKEREERRRERKREREKERESSKRDRKKRKIFEPDKKKKFCTGFFQGHQRETKTQIFPRDNLARSKRAWNWGEEQKKKPSKKL